MAILPVIDLGALWIGDVPVSPTRADFVDEAGNVVQISGYASWTAMMYSPTNTLLGTLTGSGHGQHLEFTWPEETILTAEGIHTIIIKFFDTDGVVIQCEPWKFVVQKRASWLSLEQARAQWADAPLDDIFLFQILDSAKVQCIEYAPALAANAVIPPNYLQAQVMQARALYQSVIANQNDNVGIEGFAVRVFPLDFTIRALLRPKKAIAGMF